MRFGNHSSASRLVLALVLAVSLAGFARAGGLGCLHCGCTENCHKVCRLVPADRTITTVCWGCRSEDFCVHGCSRPECRICEIVCDECDDPDGPLTRPKKLKWTTWSPHSDGHMYTKKKLMKRTVTKTVPGYKWVVEDLCPDCAAAIEPVEVPSGAKVPPPPVPAHNGPIQRRHRP